MANQNSEAEALARTLDDWLHLAGGNLPGEFLRIHGLNPGALVSEGFLSRGPGRWSDSYVKGPHLLDLHANVPFKATRSRAITG